MQRLRKHWLARLLIFVGGVFSLRLISYALHMTTLEKLYKPRDFRKTSHLEISQEIIDQLPRYCQTVFGIKMDPINLIFIGTEAGIKRAFEKSDWNGAFPANPIHPLVGLIFRIRNRTYKRGPFMPLFTGIGLQDLSFQKVLSRGYGNRHHMRVWRTRHHLPGDNRIWVAAATFENSFKFSLHPPFFFHHKSPDLDGERDYIVGELTEQGHLVVGKYRINDPSSPEKPVRDPHGDRYYTDGHATAVEII